MITLPDLQYSSTESAILTALASAEGIVPHGDLDAVLATTRGGSETGRTLRVHLHYLRKRLAPHGIKIVARHRLGYVMQDMAAVQTFSAASEGVRQRPRAKWGLHEDMDARRAAVNADLQFRTLMIRAGHKPSIVTTPSTEHPRFISHRGVPQRTGSPAGQCADNGLGNFEG